MREKRTCEKCGRHAGGTYAFHYGTKKSRTTHLDGNRRVYTTSYNVTGKKEAAACDRCIRWRRAIEAISPLLGIAVLAFIGWGVFFQEGLADLFVNKPEKHTAIKWIVTALVCMVIWIVVQELYTGLFRDTDGPGERLIIAHKRGELRRQGFDSFWDSASFRRLR